MSFDQILELAPFITAIVGMSIAGYVFNTWLRIKNGYPLEGSWGNAIHPMKDKQAEERIKLLTSENAELRALTSALQERVQTVEKIVTDQSYGLAREIEHLAEKDAN